MSIPHFNCFPHYLPTDPIVFSFSVYSIHTLVLYLHGSLKFILKKKFLLFAFKYLWLYLFRVTGYLRTSVVHINIHTYILNISFGNIVLAIYRWTNLHTYIYVHTAYKVNYSIYNIFSARVKYKFSLSLPIVYSAWDRDNVLSKYISTCMYAYMNECVCCALLYVVSI